MGGNVLFSVSTTYHLMMTKIYIHQKQFDQVFAVCHAINEEIPRIILNDEAFDRVTILDRSRKRLCKLKLLLINRRKIFKIKKLFKNYIIDHVFVFKDSDIFSQVLIEEAKIRSIKVSLIEEGVGIYIIPKTGLKIEYTHMIKRLFAYPKNSINALGINPLVDEVMVSRPSLLPIEKIQNKKISRLNYPKISDSMKGFLYNYFSTNSDIVTFKNNNPIILYLGQPFSEFGLITGKKEKEKLDLIFHFLLKTNINVLIKPHPSESIEKYKIYSNFSEQLRLIENNHIPSELLPYKYKIDLVITTSSGSSKYLKQWFDIKTLSLINIFYKNQNDTRFIEILEEVYSMEIINEVSDISMYLIDHKAGFRKGKSVF